jgi:7,8-dihydropterin-6-yl-methyl-4-(beta-D-ribofuranosyl)aminobenzene 5'-phosphate synthase
MKVTIIYDNESCRPDLEADWGFSCLVEQAGQRWLFDTGAKGPLLLANMERLGLAPQSLTAIFISHAHWDHTGGLADLLRLNPDTRVYLPGSCPRPPEARQAISLEGPLEISENLFSTGELPNGEQSLVVRTAKGMAVVVGCSHPGVGTILEAASKFGEVAALMGGLHGFQEYELLKGLALICPCHCTKHQAEIRERYPKTTVSGGAGRVLEFG